MICADITRKQYVNSCISVYYPSENSSIFLYFDAAAEQKNVQHVK